MKTYVLFIATAILFLLNVQAYAQEMPATIKTALLSDDSVSLASFISPENINNCYAEDQVSYGFLSQAIRSNARKCFNLLISKGADVNRSCDGYVPPLMHAAKYGRLYMVKILVEKGADIAYQYDGFYTPAIGQTPITYAEMYHQEAVVQYLRSVEFPKKLRASH